jgi:hypothetical protein
MAWIVNDQSPTTMMFEYIRSIDPPPARCELEPVCLMGSMSDAPDLTELVTRAHTQAPDDATSLACPMPPPPRIDLPRFSGISLGDVVLQAPEHEPVQVTASLPPEPRALLGPGAMTMTLALVATFVFGALVVTP